MHIAHYRNLTAIRTSQGVVGFHTQNLQVADLDERAWEVFSHGAGLAEIVDELQTWNTEDDLAASDADLAADIRSYSVNVTQVCNLKCTYCAAGGDGTFGNRRRHIDLETVRGQLRTYLAQTPDGETFDITFFGGEPLLALETIQSLARYAELLVAGRKISLRFRVITNGTVVTDQAVQILNAIRCHVTVSLDGPPEINDRQRVTQAGRSSTETTLKGLGKLIDVRERLGSLAIGSVFGKHNTDVAKTYAYLSRLPVDEYKFDFASDVADESASLAFAAAFAETAVKAFRSGGEVELRKLSFFDHVFRTLDQQKRIRNHCGAGKSHVYADAEGRLSACQWFLGRPEIPYRPEDYRERLQDLNNCQACWARNLCGGGCLYSNELKTGHMNRKDTAFCDRTRTLLMRALILYAEARRDPTQLEPAS